PDQVLAWIDSLPPEVRAEVSPDWIARVRATAPGYPWALSFQIVERTSGFPVGSCFFKGPPDADGVVEVAYGIKPEYSGRGFATEATAALAEFAFASGRVNLVRAHTKPDGVASSRVLTKCGFRPVGEVIDPEDGLVCRWERSPISEAGTALGRQNE
ncbi:MAG: GNAT family N-acetyltransferase, partial [Fimbriiglobus sp.]